jgi:hypothetical protein
MTPLACALVDNVRVDGIDLGPLSTYTFHDVSGDHTIEASFVPAPPDTIVASAGAGGTISPAGTVVYDCGASATYTIASDDCHLIGDVWVDGRSVGAVPSFTFTDLHASHAIAATFVAGTKFTITATSGANGTITPSGAVKVDCGADQTFAISPNACYRIADVLADGASQGPLDSYTFTNVRATHSITASFVLAAEQHTITASAGPGGTIEPAGELVVDCGSSRTFSIRHDACYRIADVVVDGVSKGVVSSFTFTDINAPHAITASFASSPQYPITASAAPGGTIVPSGIVQVECGASQAFTITTASPLSIPVIVVDGIAQDSTTSYTFTNVNDAHSISLQVPDRLPDLRGGQVVRFGPVQAGGPGRAVPPQCHLLVRRPASRLRTARAGGAPRESGLRANERARGTSSRPMRRATPAQGYTVILDVLGTGVYVPGLDPTGCFSPGGAVATTGIQDLEGEITAEGAMLSWWLMDLSSYRGFLVHRAPEGGEEEVVTPEPLAPPASHPPAQMRWRDGSAVPGSRYAYRIEALKQVGSDWYGPVRLSIPAAPKQLALRGATPNPFSGTTRLALDMPSDEGEVRLELFDVAGRHVRTLRRGPLSPGQNVVDWDGLDDHGARVRGGLYVVRLQGTHGTSVMRVMRVD